MLAVQRYWGNLSDQRPPCTLLCVPPVVVANSEKVGEAMAAPMTETELATLALLVLTYCKQRGLTEAEVRRLFNAQTVRLAFRTDERVTPNV